VMSVVGGHCGREGGMVARPGARAVAADGSDLDPRVGVCRSSLSVAVGGARGALLGEFGRQ
jgi:hypothetical protein